MSALAKHAFEVAESFTAARHGAVLIADPPVATDLPVAVANPGEAQCELPLSASEVAAGKIHPKGYIAWTPEREGILDSAIAELQLGIWDNACTPAWVKVRSALCERERVLERECGGDL